MPLNTPEYHQNPLTPQNPLDTELTGVTVPGRPAEPAHPGIANPLYGSFDDPLPPVDQTGAAKLWMTRAALTARRVFPELFADYQPLYAHGPRAEHVVAFDRGGAITVATRLPLALAVAGGWSDTVLELPPGNYTDALTGLSWAGEVPLADLLAGYPVALLLADPIGQSATGWPISTAGQADFGPTGAWLAEASPEAFHQPTPEPPAPGGYA